MKIFIRIILSILTIIVILFIGITVLFMINKNEGKVTYIGPYVSFINTGTSMYPGIKKGNLLIVKKDNSYDTGDIISFINDENIITTHRIVKIENNKYITKGDSNNFIDGYKVDKNDIYGKVILNINDINKIFDYKYYFLAFIIIVPIILFIIKKIRGHHG